MAVNDIVMSAAGASGPATFVEDVFSSFLYTGNGSTQTITNGIDLSGKGGLVWTKKRASANRHYLFDTARGAGNFLNSNATDAETYYLPALTSFNTDGFSLGAYDPNDSGATEVSWSFRKQPKFFDVVTYTGDGNSPQVISHNLGSVPGCVMIKRTDSTGDWYVSHRYDMGGSMLKLNSTAAAFSAGIGATSTTFSVYGASGAALNNVNGATYVAYIFAHNAGGFGLTGTDNVISCGTYNGTGSSTVSVTLGFEPQWVLIKKATGSTFTDGSASWCIFDNMRGIATGGSDACLYANLSGAENSEGTGNFINVTATGFEVPPTGNLTNQSACTYIYIAIRRGPMKVPTDGTKVFKPIAYTGTGTNNRQIGASTFVTDYIFETKRNTVDGKYFYSRLQGNGTYLNSTSTSAEAGVGDTSYGPQYNKIQLGYQQGSSDAYNLNNSGDTFINYLFQRAPGFFDEVCYTGNAAATRNITHNLNAVPQLIITKNRTGTAWDWAVYQAPTYGTTGFDCMKLNTAGAANQTNSVLYPSAPTSSYYTIADFVLNDSGTQYVSYLFGNCPGVSKVDKYTGNGSSQTINCGFAAGARFVLIKRTDSTGDWYVWDTARGMVAGNDPHLSLITIAAEVTTDDSVDTDNSGFVVNQNTATNVNVNGATYIYLAIA